MGFFFVAQVLALLDAVDRALGRRDFQVDVTHTHFLSVRSAQYKTPTATDSEINVADRQRPAAWSEPRGIEDSGEDDFTGSGSGYFEGSWVVNNYMVQ